MVIADVPTFVVTSITEADHPNNNGGQDSNNKSKVNESKALSLKPPSNTNIPANINSPKQDNKPVIYEEPSAD
jgi:hypothetical protein